METQAKEVLGNRIVDVEIIELSTRLDYGDRMEKKKIALLQVIAPIDSNLRIGNAMLWQKKEEEKVE